MLLVRKQLNEFHQKKVEKLREERGDKLQTYARLIEVGELATVVRCVAPPAVVDGELNTSIVVRLHKDDTERFTGSFMWDIVDCPENYALLVEAALSEENK